MSEAIFQILLIEAYLAIGLLAVAFPIFAICITYLKKEKSEIEKEKNQKLEQINQEIATLAKERETSTGDKLKAIDNKITKTKKELKQFSKQYIPLTVKGAVLSPVLYLSFALIFSIIAIYLFEFDGSTSFSVFFVISAILIVIAMYQFYETLRILERAALRTEFNAGLKVFFPDQKDSFEFRLNKDTIMTIFISSEEDVENFELYAYVPEQIKIKQHFGRKMMKIMSEFDHPNHNLIYTREEFFRKCSCIGFQIKASSTEIGNKEILIQIFGKGIKKFEKKLFVSISE